MKRMAKTGLVAVALALFTLAVTADVTSVNMTGFVKLDVEPGFNMLSFNWDKLGATVEDYSISVQDLFLDVSGLTGGDGVPSSDNLIFWVPVTGYKTLFLANVGDPLYDGKWIDSDLMSVSTNLLQSGDAFWVRSRGATSVPVTIAGQVPDVAGVEHPVEAGFNMFGSGFPTEFDPNDSAMGWLAAGAVGGDGVPSSDNLIFWVPGSGYKTLFLANVGDPLYDGKWIDSDTMLVSSLVLNIGEGVWYRHRGTGFNWQQAKPY